MPDRRRHRGPHPGDTRLFAPDQVPALRSAVRDLSWLLTRGYAEKSALQVVGNRYRLMQRQRAAVMRSACGDDARAGRMARELSPEDAAGRSILLDGYNVLTTVEAALAGGVLLLARDGCLRDMASMHGHYRKVEETVSALRHIGFTLAELGVTHATWYLDAPVSNSGRLARTVLDTALDPGIRWSVELVPDPDPVLAASDEVIATADSAVLDSDVRWFNLARQVVRSRTPTAWIVDMAPSG